MEDERDGLRAKIGKLLHEVGVRQKSLMVQLNLKPDWRRSKLRRQVGRSGMIHILRVDLPDPPLWMTINFRPIPICKSPICKLVPATSVIVVLSVKPRWRRYPSRKPMQERRSTILGRATWN